MGFSPYEQVKIGYMQSRKASGTAIGALAVGVDAKAKNAKEVAIAKNDGLRDLDDKFNVRKYFLND